MPPHSLPSFGIQKYYQIEPKFTGVYSRNTLPKTKGGRYVISLDEFKSIGFHLIALYVLDILKNMVEENTRQEFRLKEIFS